jgi:transcriptional regulator with XRE-family HTH domain
MPNQLPVQLRALRARRGWTVREAAERVGTTPDNLSRIERGTRHPRASTLQKLAEAYGVDLESLLVQEMEDRVPLAG